jgi:hypothetical protein
MKCPLCRTEARIKSNELVRRKDGSLAYRMEFVCRSDKCENHNKVFHTNYEPITPIEE